MAYIISKDSRKNGEVRKLYYIARAHRCPMDGKPGRKILFSLGLSRDLDTALSHRRDQRCFLIERHMNAQKDLKLAESGFLPGSLHYPPKFQVGRVVGRIVSIEAELREINERIAELEDLKAEFPECSARNALINRNF